MLEDGSPSIVAGGGAIYVRSDEETTVPAIVRSLQAADGVVYVLGEGKLFSRVVKPLWSDRDRVVIGSGLKGGERVCLSALDSFVEGMEVRASE